MYSSFRFSLVILLLQLSLQISAQRYLQEVFTEVSVTPSILYGVNATVINAATTGTANPENLLLDIYEPAGDTASIRPLIIYLHTGNFLPFPQNQTPSGTRSDLHVVDMCTRLAKQGYVVASCDYRLGWVPASQDQDIRNNTLINAIYRGMQDARTAARFFRKLVVESANPYRIDANKIVIAGEGAGAMIALTAATVDSSADFNLPKFIQNGTPIINELVNGNADATTVGINPLNFDTLCYINHPGYNSDFNAAFNLSGALPEISWITAIDPAIFSIHSPTDPFFPYQTDTLNVSVLNYPLFEVSGSGAIQEAINMLGNDENFLTLNQGCDDVSAIAASNNGGLTGLYPLNRPADALNDAFPWEWWSPANVNSPNGLVVNPDMSAAKSDLFQDTILAFLSPRLMCALQLDGNPCDAGLYGCTDNNACNFCDAAVNEDGSCHYTGDACDDNVASTIGETWSSECVCAPPLAGCTQPEACNYNALAVNEDGSCAFAGDPCDDNLANTSSDTYGIDCICVGVPISPSGCNPADINWAAQGYFVSPNPNVGETLADGLTDVYYSDNIYLKVPTNSQQVVPNAPSVNITSLTINNILATPSGSTTAVPLSTIGLSYQCNSNGVVGNCVFLPNQPSCIEIFGVPNSTGLYTLTFSVNVSTVFGNVPYQLQIMNVTISGPGCTDSTACNYDALATINNGSCFSQGDACDDGLNYTINDAINSDCVCEGFCAVIIPSTDFEPIACNGGNTVVSFHYNGSNIPDAVVINGIDTIYNNAVVLQAGTFSYYLITEGGCVSATSTLTVAEPTPLTLQLEASNVQCRGYATGSVAANAAGGIGSYAYVWSNGADTFNLNGVPAGNYSVLVTDANGCSAVGNINVSEPAISLGISAFTINPICGNDNGAINIQTYNAVGNVSFVWNDVSGGNQLQNIGAGIYTLIVQDDYCVIDTTIILNPSDGPVISTLESNSITCYGGNDGFISIEIVGGTAPVSVQWSDGEIGLTRSNLVAGNYIATVTDDLGCSFIQPFQLTQPDELIAQTTIQNVDCFGDNTGSVAFEISGGVQPYVVSWNDGIASSQLLYNDLSAGDYNYYIQDSVGCFLTGQLTVNGPSAPLEVTIDGNPVVCGDLLGSATAFVTGAEQVNYQWSNGAITQVVENIPVGEYYVIATSGACSDTAYFFLGNNLPLVQDSVRNTSCFGSMDGYAAAIVSGGTLPYTYEWSSFPGSPSIPNLNVSEQFQLEPGNYYVSVTEASADSCVSGFSFTITAPPLLNITTLNISPVSCNGLNDGSMSIEIEGGTGAYDILWSNSATNATIDNLTAGTYSVTVTDDNGCAVTASEIGLTEPAPLEASAIVNDVTCFGYEDGALSIITAGGTSPYTIAWSNTNLPSAFELIELPAGEYAYSITDALGCEFLGTETIGGPESLLSVSLSGAAIICGDASGVIEATVSGNTAVVFYEWSKEGIGTLDEITAVLDSATVGLYTVVVTSDGCTASDQFFLGNNLPELSAYAQNVSCFGGNDGSASVIPSGGAMPYSYQWYSLNGSPTIAMPTDSSQMNLAAGDYVVTVSESSGCISSYEFNISQPDAIQINATIENSDCSNDFAGSIELDITGGIAPYTILWENGEIASILTNLTADNYLVMVSDNNGCSLQNTLIVSQTDVAMEVDFITTAPTCGNADGVIASEVISSNGAITFVWNGLIGEAIANNLAAGTYAVEYTDGQCFGSTEIILASTDGPQIDSALVIPVSCFGYNDGAIQLYVSAITPITYLWSNATTSQNLISVSSDNYSVVITDENLCTYTAGYFVTQPDNIEVSYITENNLCYGDAAGNVNFQIVGGVAPYTLNWMGTEYTDGFSFGGLAAGVYSYQISDAEGCAVSGNLDINQSEEIQLSFQTIDITCSNPLGAIYSNIIGGTSPFVYTWSTGDSLDFIADITEGNYVLTVEDALGCISSDSANVSNLSSILDVVTLVTNPSCAGESDGSILISDVIGGYEPYTYSWSNNWGQGNYAGNLPAGVYSFLVTDSTGCQVSSEVTISDPAPLSGSITGPTNVNAGDTVTYAFSLSGGDYEWLSLSGTVIGNSNAATYNVLWSDSISDVIELTFTDANGCSITTTLNVNILTSDISERGASIMQIYPVPASNVLNIKCNPLITGKEWSIIDTYGKRCASGVIYSPSQIDVTTLIPGAYTLTFESEKYPFLIVR